MNRRKFTQEFLKIIGMILGGRLLIACAGSGGGGSAPAAPADPAAVCAGPDVVMTISANHGHTLTVTAADIAAGVDKTYSILGSSAHDHTVTITAADFAAIANKQNTPVRVSSTDAGHSHDVNVTCV